MQPPIPGLEIDALGGDGQLELVNGSGAVIVVLGYENEPYLRFDERGVEVNVRSPTHHANEDAAPPATASAGAPPVWESLTPKRRWQWHDHRVHWMGNQPPPVVREQPDVRHRILEWRIPATADGRPFEIAGTLDYLPPPGGAPSIVFLAAPAAAIALAAVALAWRRRTRGTARDRT